MIRLPGLDNRAIELTALSKYDKSGAGISVFSEIGVGTQIIKHLIPLIGQ